ncbi:MAG: tetratricopeptide repeat protein [Flavobacterium sp. JAD_PAG50586_2]|nr:MAG: tetratricopeptide repeat protein [Flavobacterium sp. JAD_PAG50586_2]
MIRKQVFSPILFFILLLIIYSCSDSKEEDTKNYKASIAKGSEFFDKKVHLDSAFYYYNLAKEYSTDKSGKEHTYALLQIATVQQYIGDYFGSEETITEALANYEGTVYKPYLYNMLAVAYDSQGKLDDALEYYKKAYDGFEDITGKVLAQNNIGLIYQQKNQHEKAIQLLKPLLKKYNRKVDSALILGNLGYSEYKLNRPDAYANLSQSLYLTDSLQSIDLSIPTNIHLAEFFKDSDNHKAKQYAINALNAAKKPISLINGLKYCNGLLRPAKE